MLRRRVHRGLRLQVIPSSPAGAPPTGPAGETGWLEFRAHLCAFVARRVANRADVDDIVQGVFLQMHRSLAEIRNAERIHAWLYTTARRAIADYYRAPSRRREVIAGDALDLDTLRPGADFPTDEGDGARQEVAACLAPLMEQLAAADRDAIVLTEIQGLRLADAASRAGLSLSGMKSRVQRARRRLRDAILDCCHVALDARGTPTGCARRDTGGGACGGKTPDAPPPPRRRSRTLGA